MNCPDSNGKYDIVSIFNYGYGLGEKTHKTLSELEKKLDLHIQTLDLTGNEDKLKAIPAAGTPVIIFYNRETRESQHVIGYLPFEKLLEFSHTYCGIKEPKSLFFRFN